jgi:hypothetical protein
MALTALSVPCVRKGVESQTNHFRNKSNIFYRKTVRPHLKYYNKSHTDCVDAECLFPVSRYYCDKRLRQAMTRGTLKDYFSREYTTLPFIIV